MVAVLSEVPLERPALCRPSTAACAITAINVLAALFLLASGFSRWGVSHRMGVLPCTAAAEPPSCPPQALRPPSATADPPCTAQRSVQYLQHLSVGFWEELHVQRCDPAPRTPLCDADAAHQWTWCRPPCQARRYDPQGVAAFFTGRRVAVIGDSHGRFFFAQLAREVLGARGSKFVESIGARYHDDHFYHWNSTTGEVVPNTTQSDSQLDFYWRTDAAAIATVVQQMQRSRTTPDIVVLSSGSWYLAKTGAVYPAVNQSVARLTADLQQLETAVRQAAAEADNDAFWLWLSSPQRVRGRLPASTWSVRADGIPHINRAARASGLMQPAGPAFFLDLESIAKQCEVWCNRDGSHVADPVNSLVVQLLSNLAAAAPT